MDSVGIACAEHGIHLRSEAESGEMTGWRYFRLSSSPADSPPNGMLAVRFLVLLSLG